MFHLVSQVITTELAFMASHPTLTLVGAVVAGLSSFLGFRLFRNQEG